MSYTQSILESIISKTPNEPEFHQALSEIFSSISQIVDNNIYYQKEGILERLAMPERIITFRVPWISDDGQVNVNTAYRVQYSSVIGPYKGGMRFHPTVNASVLKFLAFEQSFKNAITGLPLGGGKGGSDFNPKGKSDAEIMRFCQSMMLELYKYLGANEDIPAGDIGVGAREVGYMYGMYKRITNQFEGVFTGKGLSYGGSLVRPEATGYGLLYLLDAMLKRSNLNIEGKRISISGSGNVAIYALEKATELGGKVITLSDSDGFIYDSQGIDIAAVKEIKLINRHRIKEYVNYRPNATYKEGNGLWHTPCDIALPCATQNELNAGDAKILVKNGCIAVAEGANMPCTNDAVNILLTSNILFAPGKIANAGGVSVSGLEMTQNSMRLSWAFEEVDRRLKVIMADIFNRVYDAADNYGMKGNLVAGANIVGFMKLAEGMLSQGVL